MSLAIAAAADRTITLPSQLAAAREQIAEERLDVLFYTDVGMDALPCYLAHARLAPVQCVTWGHPLTTGLPESTASTVIAAGLPNVVFLLFPANRWFSRQAVSLHAPARSLMRYDVRATTALDQTRSADLSARPSRRWRMRRSPRPCHPAARTSMGPGAHAWTRGCSGEPCARR
jgi:hypothetical protein